MKPFTQANVSIAKCWSQGIYLSQLFIRFFKLTLQILARLSKWSNEAIEMKSQTTTNVAKMDLLILLYLDITKLNLQISSILNNVVEKIPINLNPKLSLVEKCFDDSRKMFSDSLKRIEQQWTNEIIEQTIGWPKQVADIPRLYRKTNREAPTKPCGYVEQILKPNETFWNKNSNRIDKTILKQCLIASISHLNQQ